MDHFLASMKSIHENISVDGYQPPSNMTPPGMPPNTEVSRVTLCEEGSPCIDHKNNCIVADTKDIMDKLGKIEGFIKGDECDTLYFLASRWVLYL